MRDDARESEGNGLGNLTPADAPERATKAKLASSPTA